MGFIDQHLMEGEQVVYRTRLHRIIFLNSIVWVGVAVAVTLHGNAWFQSLVLDKLPREVVQAFSPEIMRWLRDGWHGYNLLGLAMLVLSALPGLLGSLVNYSSSEFGVSNKRVLLKTGFISRHSLETMLSKVESIGVHQGLLGRLFGYGTIIIGGTGGSKEAFSGIRDPLEFRRQVQEQISKGSA